MGSHRRAREASVSHGPTAQIAADGKELPAASMAWSQESRCLLKGSKGGSHHLSAILQGCCTSTCPTIHSMAIYQQKWCFLAESSSWMSASTTYLVLCKKVNPQILAFLSRY